MTVLEAIELVQSEINLSYPKDKEKLFRILTLVNNKAWKEGSWWGMNKHFHVQVKKDHEGYYYFIAPNGYNVLQTANLNTEPVTIRDEWFQFHKNGNGSISNDCCGENWSSDIIDMGEVPVINQPDRGEGRPIKIGVRSTGLEIDPVEVAICGEDNNGERITTYSSVEKGKADAVVGARIAVNQDIRIIDNIYWGRIDSITKSNSLNPIEVYAVHDDGSLQILTRLLPEERYSKLRKYLVPDNCGISCIHGIFKISKPDRISLESQKMIIDDEEGLISLAISMDYLFIKKSPQDSLPYTVNGIKSLEDDNREHQSPSSSPIQVEGVDDFDDVTYSQY